MQMEDHDYFNQLREARDVDTLIRILNGENPPWMKKAAVRVLGDIGEPRAVPVILLHLHKTGASYRYLIRSTAISSLVRIGRQGVDHLTSILLNTPPEKNGSVRTNEQILTIACQALGRIGDSRAVEPLCKAITSPAGCPSSVMDSALLALGDIGSPDAVESIGRYMGSRDVTVTSRAEEILAKIGDERAIGIIRHQISRIEHYTRVHPERAGDMKDRLKVLTDAVDGIRTGSTRSAISEREVFRQLARETEQWIRAEQKNRKEGFPGRNPLTACLNRKEEERRIRQITEGLRNRDPQVFSEACRILVLFGEPAVEPVLAVIPRIPSPVLPTRYPYGLIQSVAEMLGSIGKPAVPALMGSLEGKDPVTGLIAIAALGMTGNAAAVDPLIHILTHSPDPDFRSAAASAVGETGDPRVKPFLLSALHDTDRGVAAAACRGLAHLRDVTVTGTFLSLLKDPGCRAYARQGLIDIGEPVLKPALDYYREADRQTQKEILGVVSGMDDPGSLPRMIEFLCDNDKAVRESARNAIFHQLPSDNRVPLLLMALEQEKKMRIRKDIQTTIDIIRLNPPSGSVS